MSMRPDALGGSKINSPHSVSLITGICKPASKTAAQASLSDT
jgi:hypothetical protein